MKQGYNGYSSGCCPPFEVWGIIVDAPTFLDLNDYWSANDRPWDYNLLEPGIASTTWTSGVVSYDFKPELWDRNDYKGSGWMMSAAKVPVSYPYGCNHFGPEHSGNLAGGDGSWDAPLTFCAEHTRDLVVDGNPAVPEDWINKVPYFRFCLNTRAIYIDGQQEYVNYRLSATARKDAPRKWLPFGSELGDHYLVNIADPTNKTEYLLQSFYFGTTRTNMETEMWGMGDVFDAVRCLGGVGSNSAGNQIPANCIYLGLKYCVVSSYNPDVNFDTSWQVGRVKYDGTRLGDPGFEMFFSPVDLGPLGGGAEGNFVIVLPTVRAYLDSSVNTPEDPDEPWVLCVDKETYHSKLLTTKWQSKVYRGGTPDEQYGYADGTIDGGEEAAANIIFDTTDPGSQVNTDFPDETWANLKVRCYNRVYDPTTGHSEDLVLFTSGGSVIPQAAFTADFETNDLQHNMPAEMQFGNAGAQEFDLWQTSTDHPRAGGGTYCAKTSWQDVTKDSFVELSATLTLETAQPISFWYMLDNRGYGTHEAPWGAIQNSVVENGHTLSFKIDGSPVECTIDGYVDPFATSIIDNVNVPDDNPLNDEDWYLTWRKVTATIPAGTHRVSWTVKRINQDNGHLAAWLDDIEFPDCIAGDDVNSVKRWFYAKGKVRKCNYWTYAKVDEENQTELTSRLSTVPDYITMDKQGRILLGNPHYFCRVLIDEEGNDFLDTSFGSARFSDTGKHAPGGYVRGTASPNIPPEEPPCWDSDVAKWDPDVDGMIPPWGAFQILPATFGYHIRGFHANKRDATTDPLDLATFTFSKPVHGGNFDKEQFHYMTNAYTQWSQRISCWTVSEDGLELNPHIEVLWRPTHHSPAWPIAPIDATPKWPHPPYVSDFENAAPIDSYHLSAGSVRPRDPLQLPASSNKSRWTPMNYVIARGYSNAFTHFPQVVWASVLDDPVDVGEQYDPDGDLRGPWSSAQWRLYQARFCPAGVRKFTCQQEPQLTEAVTCPDPDNPDDPVYGRIWALLVGNVSTPSGMQDLWPMTDFDVVDDGSGCSCLRVQGTDNAY